MNFFEALPYSELSKYALCSPDALKQRVYRNKITKAQAVSDCSGVPLELLESVTSIAELEKIFKTETSVERTFTRRFYTPPAAISKKEPESVTIVTKKNEFWQNSDDMEHEEAVLPEKEHTQVTSEHLLFSPETEKEHPVTALPNAPSVELSRNEQIRQRIDEWMIENTGKITAVLKSNFLSVVVMLTLSIVVATVFTSRVALAVGVTPFFAYSIAILVDVSAIIFMFRGKKWLSWVFGLNIFLQIALTSESTLAKLWFSSDTILGLKVALLATAVLTAIEGFSSLSSQNKD